MALSDACPPNGHAAIQGPKGSNQWAFSPEFGCHPSMLAAPEGAIKPDGSGAGSLGQDEGGRKPSLFLPGYPGRNFKISM